jgi:hypothetical protein
MHRTILLATLLTLLITGFAKAENVYNIGSQSTGAGAGKVTFDRAYGDDDAE